MNKVATQRPSFPLLSDLAELLDHVPAFVALRPLFDFRSIRIEDEMYDDVYQIRAEVPGVDPEEDIEVTVRDGRVTITAQRSRTGEHSGRSEFAYGSFSRSVALPDGADEDDVNAVYDRGILTVSVPLSDEHRAERHIEVVEIMAFEHDDDIDDDIDDDDETDIDTDTDTDDDEIDDAGIDDAGIDDHAGATADPTNGDRPDQLEHSHGG